MMKMYRENSRCTAGEYRIQAVSDRVYELGSRKKQLSRRKPDYFGDPEPDILSISCMRWQ